MCLYGVRLSHSPLPSSPPCPSFSSSSVVRFLSHALSLSRFLAFSSIRLCNSFFDALICRFKFPILGLQMVDLAKQECQEQYRAQFLAGARANKNAGPLVQGVLELQQSSLFLTEDQEFKRLPGALGDEICGVTGRHGPLRRETRFFIDLSTSKNM